MSTNNNVSKGIFWSLLAAIMFGIADTLLQFISQHEAISATWFLSVRTFFTGIIMLIIGAVIYKKRTFCIFKSRSATIDLIMYSVLGICFNLLASYLCVQDGNSVSMSILQYLSPLFVILITVILKRKLPTLIDVIVFVMAMLGIILVLTKGNFTTLSISPVALLWGIGAGLGQALYLMCPVPLMKDHYPPILILGWGALLSSIVFNVKQPIWVNTPKLTLALVLSIGCVVIFGTIFAFLAFLRAARYASSEIMSLSDAFEPVTVFILSFIFFNLRLNFVELLGAIIVLGAIAMLQIFRRRV